MKASPLAAFLGIVAFLLGGTPVYGQANFSFSGGSGMPLTLTLSAPVTYVITDAANVGVPLFDIRGVGNQFAGTNFTSTGTISYSVNLGANQTVGLGSTPSVDLGDFSTTDLLLRGNNSSLPIGAIVTLNVGSLVTNANFAPAAPAGGSFATYIVDPGPFTRISTNGVSAAPEPRTWTLLCVSGVVLISVVRRTKRVA